MNHEGHKEHKANSLEKSFFVAFVLFVVPDFFSRSSVLRYSVVKTAANRSEHDR
jgi:hypothetical protein